MLELHDIVKSYAGPAGPIEVIRGVSLSIGPGESLAILGPSGSGKSTLINLMGGLDRPDSGRVTLDGRDLATMSEAALARLRATSIGFVFQAAHLLPQCTALENALLPAVAAGDNDDAGERARRLLDRVGLSGRADHRTGQLSGGERTRAAVARALVNKPRLVLADEPTGALDRASAEEVCRLLVEVNSEEGSALVVATHSEALAALMGRVMDLRDGKLMHRG
jgi:lipoprotein-releasing system ATP-binding protein